MSSGDPELIEEICAEIRARGPITFARFMELALYHPTRGYYASGRAAIGRLGDFFTNVSVGSLFGKLLAAQFAEIWEKLGRPYDFQIVEQGAHDGAFAADVLGALREKWGDCFEAATYVIAEPFSFWRERQHGKLNGFYGKVRWIASLDELEPFTGIHFSNELFDALPVHLLISRGNSWKEKRVAFAGENLEFVAVAPANLDLVSELPLLPAGFETGVNLPAPQLMREIASKIARGVMLTVDYGFPRAEFYAAERSQGSLQVRAQQRKLDSPFEEIGRADISTHLNWTTLAEAAQSAGACPLGFTDQHHFLTAILSQLIEPAEVEKFSTKEKRALQTLLHPEMLGRNFQALALGQNFNEKLSGFRFASDAGQSLGMWLRR